MLRDNKYDGDDDDEDDDDEVKHIFKSKSP